MAYSIDNNAANGALFPCDPAFILSNRSGFKSSVSNVSCENTIASNESWTWLYPTNLPTADTAATSVAANSTLFALHYSPLFGAVQVTLSLVIFVVGALGNALVVVVIARTRSLHSPTNCYLMSLAVADSIVLFSGTLPSIPEPFFRVDEWPYGRLLCSVLVFLQYLGIDCSAMSIGAFTVERYIAICHPMRAHTMCTVSRAKHILVGIWIFTLCYCSPWLGLTDLVEMEMQGGAPLKTCQYRFARSSYLVLYMVDLILFYVIPLLAATVLYLLIARVLFLSRAVRRTSLGQRDMSQRNIDSRVQVIRMLVVVVVAFATLWLPYRVLVVYNSFAHEKFINLWFLMFARTMVYVNSAINPILYNVMSLKFKRAFRKQLHCLGGSRTKSFSTTYNCSDKPTDLLAMRRSNRSHRLQESQHPHQHHPQQQQHGEARRVCSMPLSNHKAQQLDKQSSPQFQGQLDKRQLMEPETPPTHQTATASMSV